MKVEIDKSILEKLKKEIINYPKKNGFFKDRLSKDLIRRNLDKIKYLYIDNLKENLISQNDKIIIDKKFVTFKENGEVKGFKPELLPIIGNQIIHKLWHAASEHSGIEGIIEESNVRKYKSLNEGITQMLSEDITGTVVNKYSDIYKDYKKIAKIIRISTTTNTILSSYLNHDDSIRMACNSIAKDDNFYDEMNRNISEISEIKNRIKKLEIKNKIKTSIEYREAFNSLFKERIKIEYYNLIINIIIPKLKTLKKEERKQYLEDILESLKDDRAVYENFYIYLMKSISLNKQNLTEERKKIKKTIISFDHRQQFMYSFIRSSRSAFKNKIIIINEKGEIIYNFNGKKYPITSPEMSAMIYHELWIIENKHIDEKNLKNIIKNGLKFSKDMNLLKRKIYFQGIKSTLADKKIIIINSLKEIEYSEYIKLNYLQKDKIPPLETIRMLTEKYKLNTSTSESGINICEVINKKTKEKVENEFIKYNAIFANCWMIAVSKYTQRNIYVDKMDQIFSKNISNLYKDFIKLCVKDLREKNTINEKEIIKYFENPYYTKIIKELFKYDSDYLYSFLNQYIKAL